jgi:hypothetical protein
MKNGVVSGMGGSFSIWSSTFQHVFNQAPRQNFGAFYKMVPDLNHL